MTWLGNYTDQQNPTDSSPNGIFAANSRNLGTPMVGTSLIGNVGSPQFDFSGTNGIPNYGESLYGNTSSSGSGFNIGSMFGGTSQNGLDTSKWGGKVPDTGTDWMGIGKSALSGIQGLASLYSAYSANKLGKEQLGLQKEAYQTNMANSIKSYNTNLETKARHAAAFGGKPPEEADKYIASHRL